MGHCSAMFLEIEKLWANQKDASSATTTQRQRRISIYSVEIKTLYIVLSISEL